MVKISLSGSGEGPGWVTAPGYSTAGSHVRQPPVMTTPRGISGSEGRRRLSVA